MTYAYCLQMDKIVVFLAISWSLLSIFPAVMIMKTSLVVFLINTDVLCDCLKLELYRLQKTVVLIKLQKVNKSGKRRMQDSKCF